MENENIHHLFFECVVARVVWEHISEIDGFQFGGDYLSVAAKWL
jgi:hypothetical protein